MKFKADTFYSLKPDDEQEEKSSLYSFYSKLIEPLSLFAVLSAIFQFSSPKIYSILLNNFNNDGHHIFFLILLICATLFVGLKLLHSIYWASRDYTQLDVGLSDFISFGAVAFFLTGRVFVWFGPFWIVCIYAVLSLVAVRNFVNLGNLRISSDTKNHDTPIEKKIQIFNAVAFFLLFLEFMTAAILLWAGDAVPEFWRWLAIAPVMILMVLNISHSQQMSAWPKLVINNEYLSAENIEDRLSAIVGIDDDAFSKKPGFIDAIREYKTDFRTISVRRADKNDIKFIIGLYIDNFGYVLDLVFPNKNLDKRNIMIKMLKNGFGLGGFGYLRFYIIEIDGKDTGMIMPEFRTDPSFYALIGKVSLIWFLMWKIYPRGVWEAYRNLKQLRALQPRPGLKELRINYIAITAQQQQQGNGSRLIRLLMQAYIESSINRFRAQIISAYVREPNTASVRLFQKARFTQYNVAADESRATDPLSETHGGLIRFTLTAKQAALRPIGIGDPNRIGAVRA